MDDPACWAGAEFASFGTLPSPRDAVTVVGYPIGGDTVRMCLPVAQPAMLSAAKRLCRGSTWPQLPWEMNRGWQLACCSPAAYLHRAPPAAPLLGHPVRGSLHPVCPPPPCPDPLPRLPPTWRAMQISATAGIVSRLEVVPYSFSQRKLLALQIDACERASPSWAAPMRCCTAARGLAELLSCRCCSAARPPARLFACLPACLCWRAGSS